MATDAAVLESVAEYVDRLRATRRYRVLYNERRCEPRIAIALVIDLIPLDEVLRPCGGPQQGVTRDISKHGVGLFAAIPIETRFLRLYLPLESGGSPSELLVEVLRSEPFGVVFDIGGRFVAEDESR
jgi:hypothetical protein